MATLALKAPSSSECERKFHFLTINFHSVNYWSTEQSLESLTHAAVCCSYVFFLIESVCCSFSAALFLYNLPVTCSGPKLNSSESKQSVYFI